MEKKNVYLFQLYMEVDNPVTFYTLYYSQNMIMSLRQELHSSKDYHL